MAELDLSKSTTTNFTDNIPDFIVTAKTLDIDNAGDETIWYFSDAQTNISYATTIPEIFSSLAALATWGFGRGWEPASDADAQLKDALEHIRGRGNDTFDTVVWNHEWMKLAVGDAFMEIVWNKTRNIPLNLIPISPERVRIISKDGQIIRYEVWDSKEWTTIEKDDMIHSSNKRIGDQIHGTSQIDAVRFVIDARNEALADERIIKHRDKALGIVYYKTNNAGKISYANGKIEKGVENGEMIGMPEDTAKIEPYPSRSSEDRQNWISYLENFIYQNFGVPRAIVTSDGTSEVGGKMGHVIFEPIYSKEQRDLEGDFWNQAGMRIVFNRPPSLGGMQPEPEKSQPTIQPNDVEASLTRE